MLFTEPHTFTLVNETKDAYGTITANVEAPICCFIEKRTRLGFNDSQVIEIGKGVIYTSNDSLTFDTGDKIKIGTEEFVVKVCHRAEGIDGGFSHWELTYG